MVFNKFSHLARPSLTKGFAHGYAQSFVAGAQTTAPFPLGKHQTTKSSRPKTAQQHTAFSTAQSTTSSTAKATQQAFESTIHHDGGLKAYYDAWQNLHHGGEWRQYQFPKLIEPRATSKVRDTKEKEVKTEAAQEDTLAERIPLDRSYSASAVDDIRKAQDGAEEIAVAQIDGAIASVARELKSSSAVQDTESITANSLSTAERKTLNGAVSDAFPSPHMQNEQEKSVFSSPVSTGTAATSVASESDSQNLLQHIKELNDAEAYQDIPPAFESLLSHGVQPSVEAYNALLASAVHIPLGKHQLASKALGIYSDMLRRKVVPDIAFYSTLIQILARRALYVAKMKQDFEQQLKRYGGQFQNEQFAFASHATEYAILVEDDALSNAVGLFNTAIARHKDSVFSTETYQLLIHACARQQNMGGMVQAYQHMESTGVKPAASIFPEMIDTFAKAGELESAVECYNEYRSLAIADDAGQFSIFGRNDAEVYASLIKAYSHSGKQETGQRFLHRIKDSYVADTEERSQQIAGIEETVSLKAIIQQHLDQQNSKAAFATVKSNPLSRQALDEAHMKIAIAAADSSEPDTALEAYGLLSHGSAARVEASVALLALHIRKQNLEAASECWAELRAIRNPSPSLLEPTVSYARALILNGQIDQALTEIRSMFSRIRASAQEITSLNEVSDQIDEAMAVVARSFRTHEQPFSAISSSNLLWAMVENGGFISHIAGQILTGLGPEQVTKLSWKDLVLTLQVQAGLFSNSTVDLDQTHVSRLDHLLALVASSGSPLDRSTMEIVDQAMQTASLSHTDVVGKWSAHKQSLLQNVQPQVEPMVRVPVNPAPAVDTFDPYAARTDYRGSTIIADELENHRNANGLKEALTRFRNIRRGGLHPRYIVYAKLITSAAKEGRTNLIHDILGMARHDVPFNPDYPVVRHGWSSILDAMVGACLTLGKRPLAEQFHQEMLEMGAAPSANTYGLYITTLKESTKTFDEATEAVKIFHRAVSEGVVPSSFLYNALIGKLGKARRIDDCLRYFQEMRAAGIRPTSVTYGTVVNALCRVSDERFAEELFDEMESMPNYKPRPAPYNSLMQYFLTTKRDSQKVLAYYQRMQAMRIQPTMHTYKLLIDTYATLDPINLEAAEGVLNTIRAQGLKPEAVHYASLIHAKGCVLHDMDGARRVFDQALTSHGIQPQACLYQALFESMVANHCVAGTEEVLDSMSANGVEMTPYIANTLIHGWAMERQIAKSKAIYDSVGKDRREPSTYESMTRAFLTAEDRKGALNTVHEMLSRGYPSAVSSKILELVGQGAARVAWPSLIA